MPGRGYRFRDGERRCPGVQQRGDPGEPGCSLDRVPHDESGRRLGDRLHHHVLSAIGFAPWKQFPRSFQPNASARPAAIVSALPSADDGRHGMGPLPDGGPTDDLPRLLHRPPERGPQPELRFSSYRDLFDEVARLSKTSAATAHRPCPDHQGRIVLHDPAAGAQPREGLEEILASIRRARDRSA